MRRLLERRRYLSIRYIERSVGSVGDSHDNALAESATGLYETELIRQHGPRRGAERVELPTLEYVAWFNNRRLPEAIGNVPPAERERAYHVAQQAVAARELNPTPRGDRRPPSPPCSEPTAAGVNSLSLR